MTAVLLLVAAPVAWAAAIAVLRRLVAPGQALADLAERAALGLMLLPVAAGLVILVVPMPAPVLAALPLHALPLSGADGGAMVPAAAVNHAFNPWRLAPILVLLAWAAGAVVAAARLAHAAMAFARIARTASCVDGVRVTPARVPAFAWNGAVVIPQWQRDTLNEAQLRLIVAHERAHLRRHDPLWFLLLGVIDAVLWFNPFVAAQTRACRLAAELACDEAAGASDRKAYARALLAALKPAGTTPAVVAAMSGKDGYRLRLDRVMTGRRPPRAVAWLCAAALLAVPATVVQFAFARGTPAPLAAVVPAGMAQAAAQAASPAFAIPTDGQLGDRYGIRKDPIGGQQKFHQGLDFIAPTGTPVKASAAGAVSFAGDQPGYGTTIEIEHGGGMKTRYTHLSRIDVAVGDSVTQGQAIGAVGDTGRSTQPHLHFEIWAGGRPQNPAPLIGLGD